MVIVVYFVVLVAGVLLPDRAAPAPPDRRAPAQLVAGRRGGRRGHHLGGDLRHHPRDSTTTRVELEIAPGRRDHASPRGAHRPGRRTPRRPTRPDAVARRATAADDGDGRRLTVRRNVVFLVVDARRSSSARSSRTLARGNEPVLGLDLQGGISVVLRRSGSTSPTRSTSPSTSSATASTASASPSPRSAGRASDIVVDLPGVKDRDKADALVGKTAELRFRPVLARAAARGEVTPRSTTTATTAPPRPPARATTTTTTTPPPSTTPRRKAAIASCDATRSRAARPRSPRRRAPTTSATRASCCRSDKPGRRERHRATTSARPALTGKGRRQREGASSSPARAGR